MRVAALFFFFAAGLLFPGRLYAQEEPPPLLLQDDAAGYVLPLPAGWREITDPSGLEEIVRRVCSFFASDGRIKGASSLRGAVFPEDAAAAPALVVFALDYAVLGLDRTAVQEIAKTSREVAAALANALQKSYMQEFPQSIMLNHHLGDDFFSLNLRTVLNFEDEAGTTRNRNLKVLLAEGGALVLMAGYDGPFNTAYDAAIAASVRAMAVLPEKKLENVNPPFQSSFLDYAMILGTILFIVYLVRRFRGAGRG
jgi:hypothetical protein